jgi:UDP-GlcNAc3NAcA epimerase
MKDAVGFYSQFSEEKSSIISEEKLQKNHFVLATIHRQENTDDEKKLRSIFIGLEEIHKTHPVVLPIHPRTKEVLNKLSILPKIQMIEPVGYYDMLELLKNCSMVITDSGGLQKEAFFNKKQCIVVRDETEWVELVTNGFAKVVGSNTKMILQTFYTYKDLKNDFSIDLYGTNVGEKIYQSISQLIHS